MSEPIQEGRVTRAYQISIVLGIVANHMSPAGRHIGTLNDFQIHDLLVDLSKELLRVYFLRGVDPLIKGG